MMDSFSFVNTVIFTISTVLITESLNLPKHLDLCVVYNMVFIMALVYINTHYMFITCAAKTDDNIHDPR